MYLMGTGQNCTKTKLHEDTFARKQICTRKQNFTKTILHKGSILHELQFLTEGHFCTRVKKQKKTKILNDKSIKKQ